MINKDEIIVLSKVHPSRITNIYLYGSRVYGTCDNCSDYDILLLGSSLLEKEEIFAATPNGKYNIHVCVPNRFEDELRRHDIHCLECIMSPSFAQLQIKKDYMKDFILDKTQLKIRLLSQSHDSWVKAKMRLRESDVYRAYKSIYHSLRILLFGIQIIDNGKIIDFTEGKDLYNEIMMSKKYEWNYFKNKYLPLKKELEEDFKNGR